MIGALLSGLLAWLLSPITRWLRDKEIRKQVRDEIDKETAEFVAEVTKQTIVEDRQNEKTIGAMDKENLVELNRKLRDAYKSSWMRRD